LKASEWECVNCTFVLNGKFLRSPLFESPVNLKVAGAPVPGKKM
jgi:hypothetical protein